MIKMKFPELKQVKQITCTPQKLSADKENKYPTGLYMCTDCTHSDHDNILYFGHGVWVRNQEACASAKYMLRYVGPVELAVTMTGGAR